MSPDEARPVSPSRLPPLTDVSPAEARPVSPRKLPPLVDVGAQESAPKMKRYRFCALSVTNADQAIVDAGELTEEPVG